MYTFTFEFAFVYTPKSLEIIKVEASTEEEACGKLKELLPSIQHQIEMMDRSHSLFAVSKEHNISGYQTLSDKKEMVIHALLGDGNDAIRERSTEVSCS